MTTTPHTTSAIAFSDRVMEVFRAIYGPAQGDVLDSVRLASAQAFTELAASAPVAPTDEGRALDLLAIMFDAYENGAQCYEDPEDQTGYLGHAIQLDNDTFHACADLLNRRRPVKSTQAAPVAPAMVDMVPPATSRDRWVYEQGRPAERDLSAAAPKADHIPDAGQKVAPPQQSEYPATGNPEADRVLGRLNSSDPEFDDCAEAAALIYKLVAEIKGPEGFSTWKDAAVYERGLRATIETTINTASPLAYLYTDGKHPGLDFEHAPAEDIRPGFVCIPLVAAHGIGITAAQKETP